MNGNLKYLKNSYIKNYNNPIGSFYINNIKIYIKDPLPDNIDFRKSIQYVLEKFPNMFFKNIEAISIGNFLLLKNREVDAIYKNNIIYISNNQIDNYDLMSDLVHEIAHCFEEKNKKFIFADQKIKNEFLSKRKKLYQILNSYFKLPENIKEEDFYNIKYSQKFDNFLYKTIGYEKLQHFTNNLFISPYAATCLREYFANAFENYFINDMFIVKKDANEVYNKLIEFLEF